MKKKLVLCIAVALLAVTVATLFAGCTPGIDAVAKKFESKGYTVRKTDTEVIAGDPESGASIYIVWYENGDDAQAAYDKALEVTSEKRVAKKGNAVAVGDEKSISIFK